MAHASEAAAPRSGLRGAAARPALPSTRTFRGSSQGVPRWVEGPHAGRHKGRAGRTWLGLRCRNFTPEEMKRSLLQALRSHGGTHTGQPPSPPSGSTPGVGKAGWRGRSPRREAAWANAWKWEPRGEPGPGERWGRLAQCHPERGVVPCQGWEQVLPGSEGVCRGRGVQLLSSSLPAHKPPLCPLSCPPFPCLPFTPPPALPPPCTPAPLPVHPPRLRHPHRHRRPASPWWWAGAHSACPACLARDAVIGTCQTAAARFRKSRGLLQSRC